jgi:peptidyl-prolyl cis-trans isomerase C
MPYLSPRAIALPILLTFCVATAPSFAQGAEDEGAQPRAVDPAQVIAYQGSAVLTQTELDAAFSKIPEEQRLPFIRDGARVDQLIVTLLKRKLVVLDAEKAGFDKAPPVPERVQLAAEKELAEAWLEQVLKDLEDADYEALAHEDYLANPDRYRSEEVLDLSHILVGIEQRNFEQARTEAASLRERLEQDPSQFDALVTEYSDDPGKAQNGGRFPEVHRGQMVQPFERVAFGLQQPGQISEPVKTNYGYHIIRLNGRSGGELPPWEAVREAAVERARNEYRDQYRARYLKRLTQDPIVIPEGAVEIMARRHFGENFELAPQPE